MLEPKCVAEGYAYVDEDGWHIKDDAPEEMKEDFKKFMKLIDNKPDENGVVTVY